MSNNSVNPLILSALGRVHYRWGFQRGELRYVATRILKNVHEYHLLLDDLSAPAAPAGDRWSR